MKDDFLAVLGMRYLLVGGFLVTAVGTLAALHYNIPWLAFVLLLPLTVSSLSCARKWYKDSRQSQAEYQDEKHHHSETKEIAEHAASAALGQIRRLLQQYALGHAVETIRRSVKLMNRMSQLHQSWEQGPPVVRFTEVQSRLFASVKMSDEALRCVREEDPFVLVQAGKDRIRHTVASLRVHQPPDPKKKSVILRVDRVFNEETVRSLTSLAEVSDQRPSGFIIELPFDPEPFKQHDFTAVEALFDTMTEHFGEGYLEELDNA